MMSKDCTGDCKYDLRIKLKKIDIVHAHIT